MSSEKVILKKFDLSDVKKDSVVVFIGKRNTGKSFLVKDLLYHLRDLPAGIVISGSEAVNKFYGNFIPPVLIYNEYSDKSMDSIFKRQQKLIEKYGKNDPKTYCFVIFDDCLHDSKAWSKSKHIKNVFMNGRHYNILFILTMQYPMGIGPELRTNIDYVFILRENIVNNRKKIHENYAGMFDKYESFSKVLNACTNDYGCLVIKNNSRTNRLQDQVFYYKAEDNGNFSMCPPFWNVKTNTETSERKIDIKKK